MQHIYRNRILASLGAIVLIAICYSLFLTSATDAAEFNDLTAIQLGNNLQVTIPFDVAAPNSPGSLNVELLDAEDKLVASQRLDHATTRAAWLAKLALPANISREDYVWYRLRYSFIPKGSTTPRSESVHSVNEILRYPVVRLLGQKDLAAGANNSLRVIAIDGRTGTPISSGNMLVELVENGNELQQVAAKLDEHGTAQPQLKTPENLTGKAELKINVTTPLGSQQLVEQVNLVERDSILLTTDKPIYQPGHLIHIRSLALDRFSRHPVANQTITYEIEDAKGNKIFKNRIKTDEYGVASAEFQLADEVNMGNFKLRAILGNPDNAQSTIQEKTFVVDRYVLPKFKIEVKLRGGEDERQQKKYYAPGETVSGRITAKYLFGKPVSRGRINIKMTTVDVEAVEIDKADAFLDDTGQYNFAMKLPNSFAGRSFEQGAAPVALQVEITDGANHSESRAESLLVSNNPILITAVPESGEMIPKLTNRVYLLTSYPDGSPAQTTISGNFKPASLSTDKDGIATVEVSGNLNSLVLRAVDTNGKSGNTTVALKQRAAGEDSLMVRTDKPLYQVGDKMEVNAISTKVKGSIYFDIIKDRQTVLTKAMDLNDGKAKLTLDLSADLFGTLEVRAYIFGRNADPISDRRIIFVDPADDLQIDAMPVKDSFRPGEDAQIDINVRDRFGRPKSAVLDLQVVDEAVFALSEKRPGLEKVFFLLEQELLKPRYEIHSIGGDDIVPIGGEVVDQQAINKRENAAKVLLAAATEVNAYSLRTEYGRNRLEAKSDEYFGKYYELTTNKLTRVVTGLNKFYAATSDASNDLSRDLGKAVQAGYVEKQDSLDPWGREIDFKGQVNGNYVYYNASIDWPGNKDQKLMFNLYGTKTVVASTDQQKPFQGHVNINAEFVNSGNYAQVVGRIIKSNNQPVTKAIVIIKNREGKTLRTRTDTGGSFQFNAVTPGSYEISIEAPGFFSSSYRWFEVAARDQAFAEVTLSENKNAVAMQLQLNAYYGRRNKGMEMDDGRIMRRAMPAGKAGLAGGAVMNAAPMPEAAPMRAQRMDVDKKAKASTKANDAEEVVMEKEKDLTSTSANEEQQQGGGEARVRSYFPETLYVNPVLITDKNGHASVRIPLADSITTWRMTMLASTKQGTLGSGTAGIKVFQDFFIDLDLPVALTQDDVVSIPVAVYNYLNDAQDVELKLQQDDWFSLVDDDLTKSVRVGAGEVSAASYRIRANRIGSGKITVTARLLNRNSVANGDAISRQVEVTPNGEQQNIAVNDRLEGSVTKEIVIPENALPDASKILVKFYPGPLSQVVEGLDSVLRMPYGCFEQSSSATYPNILVLDYMKTTKKITPEIQVKAEGYISLGYQRLVTFEVPGGGFSWFGQAPANKILTSYGLMEFFDMSKVHEVDPRILQRTQQWLANQQKPDGSWDADKNFIDEGTTNNFHDDRVRIAGYIGWALAYSGYQGQAVERARQFIDKNLTGQEDAYTLAIIANFAADYKQDRNWTDRVMGMLVNKAGERDKQASWALKGQTPTHAHSDMAEIETTALAAQALIKWGRNSQLATKALQYLTEKKDANGNWHSTQATILALKAFLLSQQQGSAVDTAGSITVRVNGQQAGQIQITKDNNDLMHQLDLKKFTNVGRNSVELSFNGKGSLLYQVVGRYYRPWERKEALNQAEPLTIDLKYDRTTLAQDDIATATVTVRNNIAKSVNMVMIDLGIPPGFDILAEDFQEAINANPNDKLGNLTKFTVTAKQAILYFDGLRANQTLTLKYRLRAKYPIKAKTIASRVYEYYNPQVGSVAKPVNIAVVEKNKK